jgi:hypothetical protein
MKIIAFGHRKRTGKDTACRFLDTTLKIEAPKLKVKRVSFAAKLKDTCYQLYNWAGLQDAQYYETNPDAREKVLEKLGFSPREIWIQVGNKLREVYQNTWLDFALFGIKADIILISDLRFPNEASRVKEFGGMLIKINRLGAPRSDDPSDCALERWTNWDKVIYNDGALGLLNSEMDLLAEELIKNA